MAAILCPAAPDLRQIRPIQRFTVNGVGDWGYGALRGIRTPDPQIRSLVLYPAELAARRVRIRAARGRCLRRLILARQRVDLERCWMTDLTHRQGRGLVTTPSTIIKRRSECPRRKP